MTEGLLGARRVREILERNGVRPQKSLGQNFVIDPNTIRKVMAAAGVGPQSDVLEIGAGAGSLTIGLASECRSVIALEFDRRLIPVLQEVTQGSSNVTVVEGDALEVDLSEMAANNLVANLPYNIATPVVMRVLEMAPQISELTVMTQREVGERLVASPGNKVYGAPTVLAAYFSQPRIAGRVSRRAFWPVPGVNSVIVKLSRRSRLPDVPYEAVQKVVRAGFSQRRKTLRNTLADTFETQARLEVVLASAGIDASARAEELGLDDFLALASALLQD